MIKNIYAKIKPLIPVTAVLVLLWAIFAIAAPQTFLAKQIYISFMSAIPLPQPV